MELLTFLQRNPYFEFNAKAVMSFVEALYYKAGQNGRNLSLSNDIERFGLPRPAHKKDYVSFLKNRRLAHYLAVPLIDILCGASEQESLDLDWDVNSIPPELMPKKKAVLISDERMKRKLCRLVSQNANTPIPASHYANKLGITPAGLRYRFPIEYAHLVKRYAIHRERIKHEKEVLASIILGFLVTRKELIVGRKELIRWIRADVGLGKHSCKELVEAYLMEMESKL
jgi:hypothetical protein